MITGSIFNQRNTKLILLPNDAPKAKISPPSFKKDQLIDQITATEVYFTAFIAEHDVS